MPLDEARRKQLDDIVGRMEAAGEPPATIQTVVDDFKQKYGDYPGGEGAAAPPEPEKPGFLQRAAEGMGLPTSMEELGEAAAGAAIPGRATAARIKDVFERGRDIGKSPTTEKIARLIASNAPVPLEQMAENLGTDLGTGNAAGLAGTAAAAAGQALPFTKAGRAGMARVESGARSLRRAPSKTAEFLARYGVKPKVDVDDVVRSKRSGQPVPAVKTFLEEKGVHDLDTAVKRRSDVGQAIGEQIQKFDASREVPEGAIPESGAVISKKLLEAEIERTVQAIEGETGSPEAAQRAGTVLRNLIADAPDNMTPAEAHKLKVHLAERTKFGSETALQEGRQRLVKALGGMIGDAVPGVKPLAGRYAGLTDTVESLASAERSNAGELTAPLKRAAARRTAKLLHMISGGERRPAPTLENTGRPTKPITRVPEDPPFFVDDATPREVPARPHVEEGVPQEPQRTTPQRELELKGQRHGGELGTTEKKVKVKAEIEHLGGEQTGTQGIHDALSAEEAARAARGEKYFKINRDGSMTFLGPKPDANLQRGEGIVKTLPGKEPMVTNAAGVPDSDILARYSKATGAKAAAPAKAPAGKTVRFRQYEGGPIHSGTLGGDGAVIYNGKRLKNVLFLEAS